MYTIKVPSPTGCDTIRHLDLTIHHTPSPRIAYASDSYFEDGDTLAVITNTEFFALNYDFFVEDTPGHTNEWDTCIWRISKESWKINPFTKEDEPDRRYCKVHVAEHNDTPVELTCSIYDSHCLADSLVQRFYLKSSFFGIDDQQADLARFSVVPNPNDGQMTLLFEQMAGKAYIKVYDMRGAKIDEFDTDILTDDFRYTYHIRRPEAGIYYFVVTAQGRTLTQKVLITP